jgi:hypothetical protein
MAKDYYDTQKKKTLDFFKGFFLNAGIAFVHFWVYLMCAYILTSLKLADSRPVVISVILLLGILIIFVEYFIIRHFFGTRRYIGIGMLASLILPLLVTGFCSTTFSLVSTNFAVTGIFFGLEKKKAIEHHCYENP